MPKSVPTWVVVALFAIILIVVSGMFVYLLLFRPSQGAPQAQPPVFPHMQLQGQFAGPMVGTVIQRWRDPVDGTICYIYTPMVVQHKPAPSGYVEYGSNNIGSISCMTKGTAAATTP